MELRVMEWNIHQQNLQGGGKDDHPLPEWIIDEFDDRDIVVLTEFCHRNSKSTNFIRKICDNGYNCAFSENTTGNDVLIAVKNNYQIINESIQFKSCGGKDHLPENLRVDIKVGNGILSIVGARIKAFGSDEVDEQQTERKRNMEELMQWIKDIQNPVIVMGDFNNYARETKECKIWNLGVLDKCLLPGFERKTPDGSSIKDEQSDISEDHFLVKGVSLEEAPQYCRDFCKHNKEVYQKGKNLSGITPGYPDHAILSGTIIID